MIPESLYTVIIVYSLLCGVIVTVYLTRKLVTSIRNGIFRKELSKMYKEKADLPFYPEEIPPDAPLIKPKNGLRLVQSAQKEVDAHEPDTTGNARWKH